MKEKFILVVTILMLVIAVIAIRSRLGYVAEKKNKEETQDVLYQDVIITAFSPTIDTAVTDYYKNILREIPSYSDPFIRIINIEQPNGSGTWSFVIEIEVEPFIGPHIAVGKDRIAIGLNSFEPPQILEFEHLKDYPLPERYNHLYLH